MTREISIKTGARIHFGLFPTAREQFLGVGAMIDRPGFELNFFGDREATVDPPSLRNKVHEIVRRLGIRPDKNRQMSAFGLTVPSHIESHQGLGSGTQFALAVGEGVHRWNGLDVPDVVELANRLARGRRSKVGTLGFRTGGLVVDHQDHCQTVRMPEQWRVALAIPAGQSGLSGELERRSFESLLLPSRQEIQKMESLVMDHLVPAAQGGNFELFATVVTEFGQRVGRCYEKIQNGIFNGEAVSRTVDRLRQLGAQAIGQSSWGPCVFCWFADDESAGAFQTEALQQLELKMKLAVPKNSGATVTVDRNRNTKVSVDA